MLAGGYFMAVGIEGRVVAGVLGTGQEEGGYPGRIRVALVDHIEICLEPPVVVQPVAIFEIPAPWFAVDIVTSGVYPSDGGAAGILAVDRHRALVAGGPGKGVPGVDRAQAHPVDSPGRGRCRHGDAQPHAQGNKAEQGKYQSESTPHDPLRDSRWADAWAGAKARCRYHGYRSPLLRGPGQATLRRNRRPTPSPPACRIVGSCYSRYR